MRFFLGNILATFAREAINHAYETMHMKPYRREEVNKAQSWKRAAPYCIWECVIASVGRYTPSPCIEPVCPHAAS